MEHNFLFCKNVNINKDIDHNIPIVIPKWTGKIIILFLILYCIFYKILIEKNIIR